MYSELLFNKAASEVNHEDLLAFFAEEKVETNILELKSFDNSNTMQEKKEHGIFKTIAAFLNTEGGIIIWGAPKGQDFILSNGKKVKKFVGELCPSERDLLKDSFISRTAGLITPSPAGILFHSIKTHEDKFAYIIEIIKSQHPPHQFDHVYYMRLDGQSIPAPHAYIEALMKQVKIPNINGVIQTNYESVATAKNGVIPFVINISNLSKFIISFNVRYTLACSLGTFFLEEEKLFVDRKNGRVIEDELATNGLYYNKPFLKRFFLVLPEQWNGRSGECQIMLTFHADNCPIKVSFYVYEVYTMQSSPTPLIRLSSKTENEYSFKHSDSQKLTEEEQMANLNLAKLETAVKVLHKHPIIDILEKL